MSFLFTSTRPVLKYPVGKSVAHLKQEVLTFSATPLVLLV